MPDVVPMVSDAIGSKFTHLQQFVHLRVVTRLSPHLLPQIDTDRQTRTDGWTDGQTHGRTEDRRTDARTDGRTDRQTDKRTNKQTNGRQAVAQTTEHACSVEGRDQQRTNRGHIEDK